jgi:hypothetical protein
MFLNADAKINKKTVPVNVFGKKLRNRKGLSPQERKCTKAKSDMPYFWHFLAIKPYPFHNSPILQFSNSPIPPLFFHAG